MDTRLQLLVFHLDDRRYALRLGQVQQVIRAVDFTPLPRAPEVVAGVINLHGQVVPLFDIRKRIGLGDTRIGIDDQFVIANASRRTVAIVVDAVQGIAERSEGDLVLAGDVAPRLEHIDGVIELDEGLVLIHNLDRFLSLEEEQVLEQAMSSERAGEQTGETAGERAGNAG